MGTLCCWACWWNQARDITWAVSTSGWCHPLPYLISHREGEGGKQQLSHQTSIKTQSEHKQTHKVWLEMVDARQAMHHFSRTEGLKSHRGGEVIWSLILRVGNIDAMISCSIHVSYINIYLSHRSISSQSSSIASDEAVLFILMITALQQTDQEGNKDEEDSQQLPFRRRSEKKRKEKKNQSEFSLSRRKISLGKKFCGERPHNHTTCVKTEQEWSWVVM